MKGHVVKTPPCISGTLCSTFLEFILCEPKTLYLFTKIRPPLSLQRLLYLERAPAIHDTIKSTI